MIYLISLPHRKDRREQAEKEMKNSDTPFMFWDATAHRDGAIGLKITMRKLFEHWLNTKEKQIVIFEDDVMFMVKSKVFNDFMSKANDELPNDFLSMSMGCNLIRPPQRYSAHLLRLTGAYATHAMIYSRDCVEVLMYLLDESDTPFDVMINNVVISQNRSYATSKMLCGQRLSKSDISQYTAEQVGVYWDHQSGMADLNRMMMDKYESYTKYL